jgi:hypothetical protein
LDLLKDKTIRNGKDTGKDWIDSIDCFGFWIVLSLTKSKDGKISLGAKNPGVRLFQRVKKQSPN